MTSSDSFSILDRCIIQSGFFHGGSESRTEKINSLLFEVPQKPKSDEFRANLRVFHGHYAVNRCTSQEVNNSLLVSANGPGLRRAEL
jgi:hypothetical protein